MAAGILYERGTSMGAFSEIDLEQSAREETLDETLSEQTVQQNMTAREAISASEPIQRADSPTHNGNTMAAAQDGPEEETNAQSMESPDSDDTAREAHEKEEAERKKAWEAKQAAKKAAEEAELRRIAGLSEDELIQASAKRITEETERLTRRNMKEYVAEYLQTVCLDDMEFARLTMHPRKSFMHCIWFINRRAREYLEKEMEANGMERPFGVNGIYGGDVPDDVVYGWAEEYYRTPDVKEDQDPDETFEPRPYTGRRATKSGSQEKEKQKKVGKPAAAPHQQKKSEENDQISLGAFLQDAEMAS